MNSQPDKEEAAGTVLKASLPFLKSDENERVKGQLSYIVPFLVYALRSIVGVSWLPIIGVVLMLVGEAVFNLWNVSTIRNKHLSN